MIDFHCHLDLFPDPAAIAKECHDRGVYVLSVTTTPSAWTGTDALAKGSDRIKTALGMHPQLAHERHSELALFDQLLSQTRYVGEIGLDGAPEFKKHWEMQLRVLEHVLASCSRVGDRIMSLHSRRAVKPVLDHLERYPQAGTAVLHWFSGSVRDLDRAIELNCWFSVGPAMLRSERGRACVKQMPRERILTESDGPFAQLDGSPVFPWQMDEAIVALSEIWGISQGEVSRTLDGNLRRLLEVDRAPAASRRTGL